MQRITGLNYVVASRDGHWTIQFQDEHCGSFSDRGSAMRSAVQDARRVRNAGHAVDVLVQRQDGVLRRLPEQLLDKDATSQKDRWISR